MPGCNSNGGKLGALAVLKEVFNWYPSHYPTSERKLLFKLDISILLFSCLCYQINISNAYVSGLKEDFTLNGNELNYFNICYYAAYVLFQIPGLLMMSRPKSARWLLPSLEILWGVCTFAQSRVANVSQLYVIRFLVGMFGAPVFAGTHFILDLQKGGTSFICNALGDMISGYLQTAANTNLSGVGAKDRARRAKIRRPGKMGIDVFKRTLKRWHIWVFIFCYACMTISPYPTLYMSLWLKGEGYSVTQINKLPTVTYAINTINIVASWLGTTLAAIYLTWLTYTIALVCCLFSASCMIVWNIPTGLKFVACPILYSTVNTIVKDDSEERALIMGSMMTFGYSFQIWVPLLLFPTAGPDDAPRWRKGWPAAFAFFVLLWLGFIAAIAIHQW
ncbi:putative pantothenate transporter [Aspergillus alliaceus]|uniref:Putative pantothenate transporter n=1 Tax=Petromyces alliaceus TaxID=209559 RepID=A0A5N7CBV8_PETAA|nr:putative pantothenate transporter [Aspergillus alliaceus]